MYDSQIKTLKKAIKYARRKMKMKTIKITDETHNDLVQLQAYLLKHQHVKYTFNELIWWAADILKEKQEEQYGNK